MSDQVLVHDDLADPMSHVPPGSIWPLLTGVALCMVPFGTLITLGVMKMPWNAVDPKTGSVAPAEVPPWIGEWILGAGVLWLLFSLMGWANQIIREKTISHDLETQERDLKQFIGLFLLGEVSTFGAIFAYFYHQWIYAGPHFAPPPGLRYGGATAAFATFILISSSVTCEIAHRSIEHGRRMAGKILLCATIILGMVFLGFQAFEYGSMYGRGFTPPSLNAIGLHREADFASVFFAGTGFHGLHVSIGLFMLFMVLFRLELGHFRGKRQFSMVAASWYWHFVDIVWVLLFITMYVVA